MRRCPSETAALNKRQRPRRAERHRSHRREAPCHQDLPSERLHASYPVRSARVQAPAGREVQRHDHLRYLRFRRVGQRHLEPAAGRRRVARRRDDHGRCHLAGLRRTRQCGGASVPVLQLRGSRGSRLYALLQLHQINSSDLTRQRKTHGKTNFAASDRGFYSYRSGETRTRGLLLPNRERHVLRRFHSFDFI